MSHRIRTPLPRTLVHLVLAFLASALSAFSRPAPPPHAAPQPAPQPPHPLRLVPPARARAIDPERRARRTAMRLALDGFVVSAGAAQAYSAGSLVLATTRGAA
ncbi:hypothetical protein EDD93_2348 [Streptomyces sp. 840.1]|uniref:hypothetical protein n=1 Tax=Streptomyces sp. 840.1 TaxID=2485152 RepID=UPI000FB815A9|nr:hypothetical protein [Streptomyces sp. 840.1]ROQ67898.1 hypothetical protein EDD93_2348 [Streptomyces sp. 840.1]